MRLLLCRLRATPIAILAWLLVERTYWRRSLWDTLRDLWTAR